MAYVAMQHLLLYLNRLYHLDRENVMNEISVTALEPFKPLFASLTRTNQAVVGQLEKWVALRMDSLRAYVDLGLAQVKVALKVTDPHSLHEFTDSQFAVLSFVRQRLGAASRMASSRGPAVADSSRSHPRRNGDWARLSFTESAAARRVLAGPGRAHHHARKPSGECVTATLTI